MRLTTAMHNSNSPTINASINPPGRVELGRLLESTTADLYSITEDKAPVHTALV
jgi:hypothetical protein